MSSLEASVPESSFEGKSPPVVLISDLALDHSLRKAALGGTRIRSIPAVEPEVEIDIPVTLPGGGEFRSQRARLVHIDPLVLALEDAGLWAFSSGGGRIGEDGCGNEYC